MDGRTEDITLTPWTMYGQGVIMAFSSDKEVLIPSDFETPLVSRPCVCVCVCMCFCGICQCSMCSASYLTII